MAPETVPSKSLLLGSNGTAADSLAPVHSPPATADDAILELGVSRQLRVRAANLRDRAWLLASDIDGVHHDAQKSDLQKVAHAKARNSVTALLSELAVDRGMSWSNIARLVGVSVGAIRKWRNEGAASGENRLALGRLAAFLDLLEGFAIQDPAGWMEMPLMAGYTVTAFDVYRAQKESALLDYASQRVTVEELLDEYDNKWRASRRTVFEVFEADDGMLAIRAGQKGE